MSVAALVLAGGASRRMGKDKLSLPRSVGSNRTTVLSHVIEVATQVADTVFAVVPPEQAQTPAFEVGQGLAVSVVVHRDRVKYGGPLFALNSVWRSVLDFEAIYVIAGDLPGVIPRVLTTCKARLDVLGSAYDGVAVMREGRWQPLLACYRPTAGKGWGIAQAGEPRLLRAFDELRIAGIDERMQGWPVWWTKPIHTPEDYETWLQWHQQTQEQAESSRGGNEVETRSTR